MICLQTAGICIHTSRTQITPFGTIHLLIKLFGMICLQTYMVTCLGMFVTTLFAIWTFIIMEVNNILEEMIDMVVDSLEQEDCLICLDVVKREERSILPCTHGRLHHEVCMRGWAGVVRSVAPAFRDVIR